MSDRHQHPLAKYSLCFLTTILLGIVLVGCSATNRSASTSPEELRLKLAHSLDYKQYATAADQLKQLLEIEPTIKDSLLRGDLLNSISKYEAAQSCYQKALDIEGIEAEKQQLYYHLALLEAEEFNNLDQAELLAKKLQPESSIQNDLRALLALKRGDVDQTLHFTELAIKNAEDNEMRAWAYYHSAQAWIVKANPGKTSQNLFNAINYASGYNLVARISKLWEEIRQARGLN